MMLRFKKVICCVLAVSMILGSFCCITASANPYPDPYPFSYPYYYPPSNYPYKVYGSHQEYEEQFEFSNIAADTYDYFSQTLADVYHYSRDLARDTSCAINQSAYDISMPITDTSTWYGAFGNWAWNYLAAESANWLQNTVGSSGGMLMEFGGKHITLATTLLNIFTAYNNMEDNPYSGNNPAMELFTNFLDSYNAFATPFPDPEIFYSAQAAAALSSILRSPEGVYAMNYWHDRLPGHQFVDWVTHLLNAGTMDIEGGGGSEYLQRNNVLGFSYDKETPEKYLDDLYTRRLIKYAQMVREGREKEFEWLRDWLLDYQKRKERDNGFANTIEAKKPNIYLYPEDETEVTVSFKYPNLLTKSEPAYSDGWTVTASPDGILTDSGGNSCGYLFYECRTMPSNYQTDEGFIVKANERSETYERVLSAYGMNRQEIEDFTEYWSAYLADGEDYVMYPILSDTVDRIMPIEFSVKPDSIYRIWFGFKHYTGGEIKEPDITPITRNGFTVVEWGGSVLD